MTARKLLIVAHTPSPKTKELAVAILSGAQDTQIENVSTQLKSPFDCDANDVLRSDAIILFTTENFSYMSGALKDFFERVYYPCLEHARKNEAKPYALVIRAGMDGTGTNTAVHKIITGLKWREVHEVLICKGDFAPDFVDQCYDLGLNIAAQLDNQII